MCELIKKQKDSLLLRFFKDLGYNSFFRVVIDDEKQYISRELLGPDRPSSFDQV